MRHLSNFKFSYFSAIVLTENETDLSLVSTQNEMIVGEIMAHLNKTGESKNDSRCALPGRI